MKIENIAEELANADPFQSWWPFIIAGVVFLITIIRCVNGTIKFIVKHF